MSSNSSSITALYAAFSSSNLESLSIKVGDSRVVGSPPGEAILSLTEPVHSSITLFHFSNEPTLCTSLATFRPVSMHCCLFLHCERSLLTFRAWHFFQQLFPLPDSIIDAFPGHRHRASDIRVAKFNWDEAPFATVVKLTFFSLVQVQAANR